MPSSIVPAVLLVDGYNIIGSWPGLKKTRDHVGLEAARGELVAAMTNYSAFQGYETQVVFDAQYQNTPSNRETITEFLTVYYTDWQDREYLYRKNLCVPPSPNSPIFNFSHDCRYIRSSAAVNGSGLWC